MKHNPNTSPGVRRRTTRSLLLAASLAGMLAIPRLVQAQFAGSVASYNEGAGVNGGYNNANAALGGPTAFIGYQNTDPFNPPFLPGDIVGIGSGGSITLQFAAPILNNGANPFGLDFIIFGHAGFNIINGDYSGGGITDGSFFTGGTATVRVSVSQDGSTFYTLNPLLAPMVDALFPTDAEGDPFLPVNPALTAADFAGQGLAGIRALYAGSAGGAGFDLSWAIDQYDQSVSLASVGFVRLETLGGVAYIDAISAVPEPASWTLGLIAAGCLWLRRRSR